jgi:hypothetical protein
LKVTKVDKNIKIIANLFTRKLFSKQWSLKIPSIHPGYPAIVPIFIVSCCLNPGPPPPVPPLFFTIGGIGGSHLSRLTPLEKATGALVSGRSM